MTTRRVFIRQILLLTLFFSLLALAAVLVVSRVGINSFNNDLFRAMDVSLAAVNPVRVERQAQVITDNQTEDYLRLKEQLIKISNLFTDYGIDSIYIMTKNDQRIYFLVDSLTPDHPRYSAPGVLYNKPPQELNDVFEYSSPALVGPYTDEYGTFLSYFKPVKSFTDDSLFGVMGVDINYSFFQAKSRLWSFYAISGTIILYILSLLLFLYYHSRLVSKQRQENDKRITENMADSLTDFFYVFDNDGKCILWNKAAVKFTGYKLNEASKLGYHKLFKPTDYSRIDKSIDKVLKTGSDSLEIDILTKDGRAIPCELNNSLLKNAQGEVVGLVGGGRDISRRREKEEELIKQKKDLEKINQLMVGRELRMIELKKELEQNKKPTK
ncbi:MAG TPA: PAS domain-containing protein [bacterium]|nr:PAS domain-containing protein [bacterium]HPT29994.1 PAS domain-containing protein [bacterium]